MELILAIESLPHVLANMVFNNVTVYFCSLSLNGQNT